MADLTRSGCHSGNGPGKMQGQWAKVYCKNCKVQTLSNGWACDCGFKWFQCPSHAREHLSGKLNRRRTAVEIAATRMSKASSVHCSVMPVPEVMALQTRKAPRMGTSLNSNSFNSPVQLLPPRLPAGSKLGNRFPHLVG